MKRLISLLLALVAAMCITVVPAKPAVADGPGGFVGELACNAVGGGLIGPLIGKSDLCEKVGEKTDKEVKKAWKAVKDSILGDIIESAQDAAKWVLKRTLTVALIGPSLDLEKTGLFGRDATLAGMLVWLGWIIATVGLMWQLGKMAVTGQLKFAGQALVGWVQNALLTGIGVAMIALLLKLGDALTTGLVDKTFSDAGDAYTRIIAVMLPIGIDNPVTLLCVVAVILLVGFIQMVLVFLRQSAIPIQALLLPIAGAGRVGGDTTRQWAPRLITSILTIIAYKPILAIIICTGFAEFGHSKTLAEWLRGLATLILAILAPGPLMKIFAPIGDAVGSGLAAGGAIGAAASVGSYIEQRRGNSGGGGGDDDGGAEPVSAVQHAQHVQSTMPKSYQSSEESGGGEAVAQAARNAAQVPGQAGPAGADGAAGLGATTTAEGTGTSGVSGAASTAGKGAGAGLALEVLDGVTGAIERGANEMGDGGSTK
ncbi:hypothetical protein M1P56_35585 (plasmid) [Streptomyces sp. HU2014]|uniref:hypothetical protein n=1 Tax=Streptomyces sp. HU2014 TaxID=2939414 RepID=UPI00200D6A47|nr:hypothetical protein [Streptomyces sp. HU2014]UQI49814.1 hypothetical protein M1P56_35585 [Streptomyces sp. HU2014]